MQSDEKSNINYKSNRFPTVYDWVGFIIGMIVTCWLSYNIWYWTDLQQNLPDADAADASFIVIIGGLFALTLLSLIFGTIWIRQHQNRFKDIIFHTLREFRLQKLSPEITRLLEEQEPRLLAPLKHAQDEIFSLRQYAQQLQKGQPELPTLSSDSPIHQALGIIHHSWITYHEEIKEQQRLEELLTGIQRLLATNAEIHPSAQSLVSFLSRSTNAKYIFFWLTNDPQYIRLTATFPISDTTIKITESALGEGLAGQCALERNIISTPITSIQKINGATYGFAVPLVFGNEIIGVIECGMDQAPPIATETFLERVAPLAAAHFAYLLLNQKLKHAENEKEHMVKLLRESETEKQKTLSYLDEAEKRLQSVESAQSGQLKALSSATVYYEIDLNGFIIFANERFAELCKLPVKDIEGHKHDFNWNKTNGEAYADLFDSVWIQLSDGKVWQGLIEKKNADGQRYWVNATIAPVFNADNQPVKYLCIEFDITEQKLQEARFQEASANYQKQQLELDEQASKLQASQDEIKRTQLELSGLINSLNNAAIVSETDIQGRIITINDNFLRISKYSREELIGENHRLLKSGHQPDDVFETLWKTVSKGQVWKGEFKNRAKDGSYFWVSATITPVFNENNQIIKYISVSYNISAQKLQDEQLRAALQLSQAQEAELRINAEELQNAQAEMRKTQLELRGQIGALNNAGIVAETDLRGNITFVNDAFCELSKYTREELIKKNHRMLKSGFHPDEYFIELWENISKGKVWKGKFKNRACDGTFYWVISTITPVLGFDGKPVKYIGVSFEMTAIVSQEEQLKEALERSQSQEEALRRNEQKMLETQIELKGQVSALHNSAIVSETDPSGNIISVNDQFIIISRYLREELIGQNHRILKSDAHDEAFFKNMWQTISEGRIWKGEMKNKAKDGTEYWVTATIAPVLDTDNRPIKYIGIQYDISTIKTQQAKLKDALTLAESQAIEIRDKQQQMDSIFSNIPGIIYRRLPDSLWTMILISDHVEDIIGIPASDFIHHRRSYIELIHPEDIFILNQGIEEALQNRTSFNLTYRLYNARREMIWVREEGRGVFNEFGNLIYVDGAIFDVTIQKKLEENLRRTLEQSQRQQIQLEENARIMQEQQINLAGQISALNNAGIVSETDVDGKITYVNDEAVLTWGYTKDELIGQNHRILKSKEHDTDFYAKMWLTITNGNVWKGVIKNRTKDESEYWSLLTITPVLDNDHKPMKFIAVAYDITREKRQAHRIKVLLEDTKKKEIELRNYAEALEKIQENILNSQAELTGHMEAINQAAIVTETDETGRIISINEYGLKIWGYSRSEVIGHRHNIIKSNQHDDSFFAEMWQTISSGRTWQGIIHNQDKQGKSFSIKQTIQPVLDHHSQPIRYIGIGFVIENQPNELDNIDTSGLESFYQHQLLFLNNKITELEQQLFKKNAVFSPDELPFAAAWIDATGTILSSNQIYREIIRYHDTNGHAFSIREILTSEQWEELIGSSLNKKAIPILSFSDELKHISIGFKSKSNNMPDSDIVLHVLFPVN
jgi:PAS domain S-box-containing protein